MAYTAGSTPISGVSGSFTFGDHYGRFLSWEVTTVQDANDASGFGATDNWRTNLSGMRGYRIRGSGYLIYNAPTTSLKPSFSGTSDAVTTDTGGVTFTCTAATGATYTGVAVPTSFVMGTGVNGNATFSLEAVGNGALTETWDQTT